MHGITGISLKQLRTIFAEEIDKADGRLRDCSEGRDWLIAKSVLPWASEILPDDRMQGGVCMHALGDSVCVYPYAFRQVCANGAIMQDKFYYRALDSIGTMSRDDISWKLRSMIQECCREEVFRRTTAHMRSAAAQHIDLLMSQMSFVLGTSLAFEHPDVFVEIRDRFLRDNEQSLYALINAVTSVARDTRDPRLRWRLEKLGGRIASGGTATMTPPSLSEANAA